MQPLAILVLVGLVGAQASGGRAAAVLARYVDALGGQDALRKVQARVTEGDFDNGRGLRTRFRIVEQAPNRRLVRIGPESIESDSGSGRGFDGATGWDKNFIGTGLRLLTGRELADLGREADLLRPLHLFDDCPEAPVETDVDSEVVRCDGTGGARVRFHFSKRDGLLLKQEVQTATGPPVTISYENYRLVDGVRVPFTTRIAVPNATIVYAVDSVRHDVQVDGRIFQRPRGD